MFPQRTKEGSPTLNVGATIWDPKLNKKGEKQGSQLSSRIHLPLLPDCGTRHDQPPHFLMSCLPTMIDCIPSLTVSQNKTFFSSLVHPPLPDPAYIPVTVPQTSTQLVASSAGSVWEGAFEGIFLCSFWSATLPSPSWSCWPHPSGC